MTARRELTNPAKRGEIRPDLPSVKIYRPDDLENSQRLLDVLSRELAKEGETLETVGHITIAYPHKHPEMFPDHANRANDHVTQVIAAMQDVAPNVVWKTADAICETKKLNRSKDQSSVHAITQKQEYAIHEASQRDALPFLEAGRDKKSFFVIVDDAVLQGTTVVNLMGYIEHNGGKVLMVSARESNDGVPIAPRAGLGSKFNWGHPDRLTEMGEAFSQSAKSEGHDWSPKECMAKFEAALEKHGVSLKSISDGECERLIDTVKGQNLREDKGPAVSFTGILGQLKAAEISPQVQPTAPKRSAPST